MLACYTILLVCETKKTYLEILLLLMMLFFMYNSPNEQIYALIGDIVEIKVSNVFLCCVRQVRKTLDATMQTLQDMLTVEDFDVSEAFQHSQSTESVKSASSDSYMSKANITKRRANQQETEGFYFTVSSQQMRAERGAHSL